MARATGYSIAGNRYHLLGTLRAIDYLPLSVRFFVMRFDRGAYPHLELEIDAGDIGTEIKEGEIYPISIPDPTYVPAEPAQPVREPEKV